MMAESTSGPNSGAPSDSGRSDYRLANDAWEAYYRAQATIGQSFADADIWEGLLTKEYAVLYALSTEPEGLRITELGEDVLLTQPGMSRLIARLETRGLVERTGDAADARARRIRLTTDGRAAQRAVGRNLARRIAETMTRSLDRQQLETLRDVSVALLAGATGTGAEVQRRALERKKS
ncbi:MarR family winged helix-turn-helix transcriptional regulator [Herbiconiux sp. P17]|uniref:MarR family winged helix-turn-helix transcriptional regulator n=1 Tax=Herbiconiux wuyangfengii TaxID=3342794 RepID=UPI0035BB6B48